MQNIFIQYLSWQFWEMPKELFLAWQNFLKFNLNFFSVLLLLKTFFSPWRRYKLSYGKGFDVGRYLEAAVSNLIFRILGALIRSVVIFIGLLAEALIAAIGIIVFLGWLVLPALLIAGLFFGLKIIF